MDLREGKFHQSYKLLFSSPELKQKRDFIHSEYLGLSNWEKQSDGGLEIGTHFQELFFSVGSETQPKPSGR